MGKGCWDESEETQWLIHVDPRLGLLRPVCSFPKQGWAQVLPGGPRGGLKILQFSIAAGQSHLSSATEIRGFETES